MALFGIGGSKSKSSSQQQSAANGESWSTSTQLGGGYQGSVSQSGGGAEAIASSQQRLAFEDLYAQLYGNAGAQAGQMAQNPFLSQTANQLFSSGSNLLDGLQQDAGSDYLRQALSSNDMVDQNIQLLGEDINKFLGESALPTLRRTATGTGQLGGTRQGVAESGALQDATNAFARGAADIRNQNLTRQMTAAGQLSNQNITGIQTGLMGNESLYELASQGFNSQLSPYAQLSQIMGGPTTLGSSLSTSTSWDAAMSEAFGEDFNFASSDAYAYDQATSSGSSKSKSSSFNLGFG